MLKNKNFVVTGALQGIGKTTVEKLAEFGATVFACAHYLDEPFINFCRDVSTKYGVDVIPEKADFSNQEDLKELAKRILAHKVPLHGLVNIVGITKDALFQMLRTTDLREIFEINVVSTMFLTQSLSRNMQKANGASIVNVSSISALDGVCGQLAYGSSKAALLGATRSMARELGSYGIRVNAIAPGVINTSMNQSVPKNILDSRLNSVSLKRMGDPKEVANVIAFLLSDRSSYMTGQVIRIDGGMA